MASFEIVSEIYKFRVRALQYDGNQLAQALRDAQEAGGDEEEKKKKKKNDELVAPIPAKEKGRLARKVCKPIFLSHILDSATHSFPA